MFEYYFCRVYWQPYSRYNGKYGLAFNAQPGRTSDYYPGCLQRGGYFWYEKNNEKIEKNLKKIRRNASNPNVQRWIFPSFIHLSSKITMPFSFCTKEPLRHVLFGSFRREILVVFVGSSCFPYKKNEFQTKTLDQVWMLLIFFAQKQFLVTMHLSLQLIRFH